MKNSSARGTKVSLNIWIFGNLEIWISKNLLIGINCNRANECLKIVESRIVRAKIHYSRAQYHYHCHFQSPERLWLPITIFYLSRALSSTNVYHFTAANPKIRQFITINVDKYCHNIAFKWSFDLSIPNNSILQCIRASRRFFNTYRIVKNRLSSSSLLIYVFPVTSSLRIFSSNCLRDDRANWPIDWLLNESLNRMRIVYINIHCSLLNFNNISETYSFSDFMDRTSRNKI